MIVWDCSSALTLGWPSVSELVRPWGGLYLKAISERLKFWDLFVAIKTSSKSSKESESLSLKK